MRKIFSKLIWSIIWFVSLCLLAFTSYGFLASYEYQGVTFSRIVYLTLFCIVAFLLQWIPRRPVFRFISRFIIAVVMIFIVRHRMHMADVTGYSAFF